jgi:hypothetical protein
MNKIGFFEEAPNQKSFMRLESFLVLIFFFLINAVVLVTHVKALAHGCDLPKIDENFLWFDSILLAASFCPKVVQKLIEAKFNLPVTGNNDKPA